ncbi:hypothetical protein [Phenylobacterium sp.]|jgi:hypothetical protein|uniref:hypothetical protein n=1 Tax=Phenylobacterium sp. TaxID=1871053 RepID=UPI002F40D618
MTTIIEKLHDLFRCARSLNEALWDSGIDSTHMSLRQLADHVTKLCGVVVEFKQVDVETDHIFGHIEVYDDGKRAIVYVVKNISERFKHAVIAKELCQLLLDKAEDWQPDGKDTLQKLVVPIVEIDAQENIAVRSEQLAERLSWELLYPIELRRKDIAEGQSHEQIAGRVRLPVQIVGILLSASYMSWCQRWWDAIWVEREAEKAAAAE